MITAEYRDQLKQDLRGYLEGAAASLAHLSSMMDVDVDGDACREMDDKLREVMLFAHQKLGVDVDYCFFEGMEPHPYNWMECNGGDGVRPS